MKSQSKSCSKTVDVSPSLAQDHDPFSCVICIIRAHTSWETKFVIHKETFWFLEETRHAASTVWKQAITFKWKHCRNYLPLFILFPWSLFQPQISMFYQCKLPHMLKVIFITFFWNLIHRWVTPSRLLQYVCVFSTNWEAVCTCEDWAAVLLQLHVLAHRGVGYVSLRDGIVLGRCIHFC